MTMLALDQAALEALSEQARGSPRLRAHRNLHPSLDDPVNRLAIAIEPGSYVRPHCHPQRFELLIAVRGAVEVLAFDDDGTLLARQLLAAAATPVIEMPPNTWHTLRSLATGSVFFEVKQGLFEPAGARFAPWAPLEQADGVGRWLAWFGTASIGERPAAG